MKILKFNNSYIASLKSTHYKITLVNPYLLRALWQYQKHSLGLHGLGKFQFEKINKTNNLLAFY